ncbi:MAG: hypothetical protein QMD08_05755 [Actinomycetota bacterium]|nr:hypothetical protein [Actinomycetota bacterium]
MKVLAGNTSVVIEPSLGIGEETLNAVDVGSSADVFLFAVQDPVMSPSKGENPISFKVVSVVDTTPSGVFQNEGYEGGPSSVGNGEGDDFPISLIHPEDQLLSLSSPASFALSFPAKEGLVKLKFSREGLHFGERSVIDGFPEEPKSSVGGGEVVGKVKPCSVAWNTQTEEVEKMYDFVKGDAKPSQVGAGKIGKRVTAVGTPESLVATPEFPLSTLWADPSSAPSELDKKPSTFWQTICQGYCLVIKHKGIISQYQLGRNHQIKTKK